MIRAAGSLNLLVLASDMPHAIRSIDSYDGEWKSRGGDCMPVLDTGLLFNRELRRTTFLTLTVMNMGRQTGSRWYTSVHDEQGDFILPRSRAEHGYGAFFASMGNTAVCTWKR